jgi:tetratricopeptide (TPR) repeat protein
MAPPPDSASLKGNVAVTGRLASMKRVEAFALIRQRGGMPRRGVTKGTGLLVVGQLGWPLLADGRPSNSLSRARSIGVPIASERQFLEWIGKAQPDDEIRSYTPERLASLAGLPIAVVEELSVLGLIDPREGRYRFRDLAAARQVAELLGAGVTLSAITRSLHEIGKWLPDAGLANLKLFPAAKDAILVEQLKGRTDQTGQFVLPVDQPSDDPDLLFDEAQSAEEVGDLSAAERLYRRVMKIDPGDPAAAFNLGNLLCGCGRKAEAEAAYRQAVKTDKSFAEAWYNLADFLDRQGRTREAIDCLKRALAANPDYADAVFNLAMHLQTAGQHADAIVHWKHYLTLDPSSAWSVKAKRALKFCEMQVAHST